jgi:hypothetical protein
VRSSGETSAYRSFGATVGLAVSGAGGGRAEAGEDEAEEDAGSTKT